LSNDCLELKAKGSISSELFQNTFDSQACIRSYITQIKECIKEY
jgi:hypothetical protein